MRAERRRYEKTADFSGHAVQLPLFARICERTTRSSAIPAAKRRSSRTHRRIGTFSDPV
jgi:hypothetical protein